MLPAQVDGNVPQLVDHVLPVTHPQYFRGLDGGVRLRGFTDHDEVFDLSNIERREDAVNVVGYAEQNSIDSSFTKLYVVHAPVIALSKRVTHYMYTHSSLHASFRLASLGCGLLTIYPSPHQDVRTALALRVYCDIESVILSDFISNAQGYEKIPPDA